MRKLLLALALLAPSAAFAAVTDTDRTTSFAPCSGATVHTVDFFFLDKTHLVVTKTLISSGVETVLTYGTQYSVILPTGVTDGSVTLTSACTSSYNLLIERVVPYTQTTRFAQQGTYSAAAHEKAFDKLTMEIQQLIGGVAVDSDITTAIATHAAAADPHTGYFLLAGRSSGQTGKGGTAAGEDLTLMSTAHATKGSIFFGTSAYDEVNNRLGIGDNTPDAALDIVGDAIIGNTAINDNAGYVAIMNQTNTEYLALQGDIASTAAQLTMYGSSHASYPSYATFDADYLTINDKDGFNNVIIDETNGLTVTRGALRMGIGAASGTIYGSTTAGGDLNLISTTNGTLGTIFFGTASGFDDVYDRLGIGTTTPTYKLEVRGTMSGQRPRLSFTSTVAVSGDTSCNAVFTTTTNGDSLELPDADSYLGCQITLFNLGTAAATAVNISPGAAEGIYGECNTGPVSFTGTAGTNACNTGATSGKGDTMTVAACASNSWCILECSGNWTFGGC